MEPGRMVSISGLANRTDLNGQVGQLLHYNDAAGRWGVKLEHESIRIKVANLTLVDSMTIMPPIADDEGSIMRASGPTNLESSGPVHVMHNSHKNYRRLHNLPADAIIKTVTSPQGQYTMHYGLFRWHMQNVNIGDTRQQIADSFSKGVWIGIHSNKLLNPQSQEDPLFCTMVGDDEWIPERDRLCRASGLSCESLDLHVPPRSLSESRHFNILGFKMDTKIQITYLALVKDGANNTEQHLLPMLLTDTTYACNAVMIYARLSGGK